MKESTIPALRLSRILPKSSMATWFVKELIGVTYRTEEGNHRLNNLLHLEWWDIETSPLKLPSWHAGNSTSPEGSPLGSSISETPKAFLSPPPSSFQQLLYCFCNLKNCVYLIHFRNFLRCVKPLFLDSQEFPLSFLEGMFWLRNSGP